MADVARGASPTISEPCSPRHQKFMSAPKTTPEGIRVVDIPGRLSARTKCPLCIFLTSMRLTPGLWKQSQGFQLRAFPSLEASHLIDYSRMPHDRASNVQRAYFAVVPNDAIDDIQKRIQPNDAIAEIQECIRRKGAIYRALPDDAPPDDFESVWGRSLGPNIDMNIPRTWLRTCRNNHRGACSRSSARRVGKSEFRLIDCHASPPKVVLRTPNDRYVALSYVWGPQPVGNDAWPQVILDAVEVTKGLGFRYLWVDRYCVDQNSTAQRHHLIRNMDSVYEGAEVTIIAAAGDDASCGLPGIGSTPRRPQPQITIDGDTFVSSMRDPQLLVENSVWYTRGWTYQEALLSRRRLIFTKEQIFWDCRAMVAQESIHMPISLSHTSARDHMGSWMRSGVFDVNRGSRFNHFSFTGTSGTIRFDKLSDHVNAYTRRNLTKDTDSLLAFKGIIKRYDLQEVRFVFGLPVYFSGNGSIMTTFVLAVSDWMHDLDPAERSTGSGPFQQLKRREHLPSWTWAGWRGAVKFPMFTKHTRSLVLESTETSAKLYVPQIRLSLNQQHILLDLAEMESLPEFIDDDLDLYLNIVDAYIVDKHALLAEDQLQIGAKSIGPKFSLSISACKTRQTFERWIATNEVKFVLTYWNQHDHPLTKFLILRKSRQAAGDGNLLWHRIGTMQSTERWYGSLQEYIELNGLVQNRSTILVG